MILEFKEEHNIKRDNSSFCQTVVVSIGLREWS